MSEQIKAQSGFKFRPNRGLRLGCVVPALFAAYALLKFYSNRIL